MTDIHAMLAQLRDSYISELPERLQLMGSQVLALRSGHDGDNYQDLYRHVHSVKGSSGTHGLSIISAICHQFEDELSAVAQDLSQVTDIHVNNWLAYIDLIADARTSYVDGEPDTSALETRLHALRSVIDNSCSSCLLVDTHLSTVQLVSGILDKYTVHTTVMEDGYQVLGRLLADKFDMLICGMEIASLNGMGLIAAIKSSNSVNRDIPSVLITSSNIREHGRNTDPDYIVKRDPSLPERIDELCTTICCTPGHGNKRVRRAGKG